MDNLTFIIEELEAGRQLRSNLSALRKGIKDESSRQQAVKLFWDKEELLEHLLKEADAKTRKNAALLIGDLGMQDLADALYAAYEAEETRFVKSAYPEALLQLETPDLVDKFKNRLQQLRETERTEENSKHIDEEIRQLQQLVVKYEGITHHKFAPLGKEVEVLLLTNRNLRENIAKLVPGGEAKVHPLGVLVHTDDFTSVSKLRLYRELVFPVHAGGMLPAAPAQAAEKLWQSDLYSLLSGLHTEGGCFSYRLEVRSSMDLEKRSDFARRFTAALDQLAAGKLVNSTSEYEVEIRLIASKEGNYFPCLKLYTYRDTRFSYRRNSIAASMNPSTAALIAELAKPYLRENAQIMDPFCGVGTLLIERNRLVPAREMYATDIFGDAIVLGRENAGAAKCRINFIHRDFFDFHHDYLFDEIITDMPMRGRKTREEMDGLYTNFFRKLPEVLKEEAVVILYTNESAFVRKQLRLHPEFGLLQETNMQKATAARSGFDLFILRYQQKQDK